MARSSLCERATHMEIVPTYVSQLDILLGGGIPQRHSIIVTGEPGTGKTVLCSQIAFAQAKRGNRVVIATLASEAQDKLLGELSTFNFASMDLVGEEVFVVSAYPWVQKGPKEGKELLLKTVRERKAKLLFVDGLRSLRDLWQDEAKLREFLYELSVGISQLGAVGLFTTEYPLSTLMTFPEATTVDGLVSLSTVPFGGRVVRRVRVAKLRGRAHLAGEHAMHITGDGVCIVPRLEETTHARSDFVPSTARAGFGLPEFDAMLRGGLPIMTMTVIAGSTGVGKTLLALHFLAAGAAKGEPGLLVSYSEPPQRLVARAQGVSLDLRMHIERKTLHLLYEPSIDAECDDRVEQILSEVKTRKIRRLVVDGIGELEATIQQKERMRGILSALNIHLREMGVTTIFIKEVAKIAGPDLDFSDTPLSVTAENLLFMRHIEHRGRIVRIATIIKIRDSDFDSHMRRFEITRDGLRVLDPIESAHGLLTGLARPLGSIGDSP